MIRHDTVEVPSGRYPAASCVAPCTTVHFSHAGENDLRHGATMQDTDASRQLCDAITRRSLVMFEYGDLIRVVEPHRVGINSAGHAMLSGWLRAGYSRSDPSGGWRNYLLSDISGLQLLDAPFAGTRPGYAAHDARMREVFCELTPSAVEASLHEPTIVHERGTTPPSSPDGARRPASGIEPPEAAI